MKKLLFIALLAFCSCESKNEKTVLDPDVEMKAFSNINFGIPKKEYDLKVFEIYKIGNSDFTPSAKFTSNDMLYRLDLYSEPFDVSEADSLTDIGLGLIQIISSEYGDPVLSKSQKPEDKGISYEWTYGSKKISIGGFRENEKIYQFLRFFNSKIEEEDFLQRHSKKTKELEQSKDLF